MGEKEKWVPWDKDYHSWPSVCVWECNVLSKVAYISNIDQWPHIAFHWPHFLKSKYTQFIRLLLHHQNHSEDKRQMADGRGQKGKTDRVWQLGWSMMRDSGGQWETGWVTYGGRRVAKLASLSMTCDVMAICILVMIMMMMTTGNDHNNKIKTITQKTIWRCQARLSFCSMTCHNDQKWLGT